MSEHHESPDDTAKPSADAEVVCPECFYTFWPQVDSVEMTRCPQCGHRFPRSGGHALEDHANPFGPFQQPRNSRIKVAKNGDTRFYRIPGDLPSPAVNKVFIYLNIIAAGICAYVFLTAERPLGLQTVVSMFLPACFLLTVLYAWFCGVRDQSTIYEIWLTPQSLRVRRIFRGQRNFLIPITAIDEVRRKGDGSADTEAWTDYHIEIGAGSQLIKIEASLSAAEQHWLCWEIREYANHHGAPLILPRRRVPSYQRAVATEVVDARWNEPPTARPGARIERTLADGNLIFRIPRGKCDRVMLAASGGFFFFPVVLALQFLLPNFPRVFPPRDDGWVFFVVFAGVGSVLLHRVLTHGLSTHELTLGPSISRLRRKWIFTSDSKLSTRAITTVRSFEFFRHSTVPTMGLLITDGARELRIKAALSVDERRWLTEEICEFTRQHGAQVGSAGEEVEPRE